MNLIFKLFFAIGLITQTFYDFIEMLFMYLPSSISDGFLMGFDSVFDVFDQIGGMDGGIEFIDDEDLNL